MVDFHLDTQSIHQTLAASKTLYGSEKSSCTGSDKLAQSVATDMQVSYLALSALAALYGSHAHI